MKHLLEKAEEVANEVFDLIESTDWDEVIEEGSGGTPVDPIAAVPSKDRAKVEDYYKYFKNVAPKGWTVELRGLQIVITMDKYSQPGPLHDPSTYDNTPNQTPLPEQEEKTIDYAPFIADILEYMHKQGMNIKPIPNVVIKKDKNEAVDIFGKTAYYQPQDKEIVLFVLGRHPKDVLRSFCHEMIHHIQNIEGRLDQSKINTSNTQENDYVDQLEQEAHGKGSYLFRSWEDSRKAADINPLEEEQEIDPEELKIGEKEELEHTKDPKVARQIAIDHLKEDPKYYSKLKQAGLVGEVSQEDAKKKSNRNKGK